MAVHRHSDDANVVEHGQCSGAAMCATSYAHALRFDAEQGQGLFGGAPECASTQSSPRALYLDAWAAHPDSPAATAEVHACAAPLSDIMAQLWETTDPEQLHDLLRSVSQQAETITDPDDSEPDEPCADTHSSAASSPMGEEHVMELIEHIITSCTPVAEAHALLGILAKAGTVPWKSMPPYLKVLRAWHHECGRRPVLCKDLGIVVSDASTLPTCVRGNAEWLCCKNECGLATCRILRDEFVNVRNEN